MKCELCGSSRHATALHPDQPNLYPKSGDGVGRVVTKVTDMREKVNLEASDRTDNVQRIDEFKCPYPICVHNYMDWLSVVVHKRK